MHFSQISDTSSCIHRSNVKDVILRENKCETAPFPDTGTWVKPMMTLPAINTDASKHEKEQISRTVQEMFEEADVWLVSD
ncbi:DinI-like family protein [Citrobacter freundii]|nr:DinI-like family protein [Citrobacter freundii]